MLACIPAAWAQSLYDLKAVTIEGEEVPLKQFAGKVALVVNTASKCGFTPQYADLEALYRTYKDRGFIVLGFPSNDFANQEPGSNEEVAEFCRTKFKITFPLFQKGPVKGADKQPVYQLLTEQGPEEFRGEIGWNFEKFLVGRDGKMRARFGYFTNPLSSHLRGELEKALNEGGE